MRSWGTWTVALASVVAVSCNGGLEVGQGPTTTVDSTTTTAAPSTTTTAPAPAQKATTKTTVRPRPTTTLPELDEIIEITPAHVEPFLLDHVPGGWFPAPEDFSKRGPMDRERTATDAAGDDAEAAAEVRKLLERIGFVAGYSRQWNRPTHSPRYDTTLTVTLLLFTTPAGADAYLGFRGDVYGAVEDLEEIYFPDPPNARAWVGGDYEDGTGGVVVCGYDGFLFEIVTESESSPVYEHRSLVKNFADLQHQRLRAALE